MTSTGSVSIQDDIQRRARTLRPDQIGDYDPLMDLIGDARFVLLGEASHGTHEFYRERAQITKRLIREKGFSAIAVEADFPDAYRVNRYVRGESQDQDAAEALSGFKRFPAWMWRNADVLDLVGWLREYNDRMPALSLNVGFYGLDLYSLHTSVEVVLNYFEKIDPDAAARARKRYSCFDHFGENVQGYGYAAASGLTESCENEVVSQLLEMNRRAAELAGLDGRVARDDFFAAEQNARLVKNAERYYRMMYRNDVSSWNLRDLHMAETLSELDRHLTTAAGKAKIVVWEHNSHLGDARATEMARRGEWNVGQLVRQRYGNDSVLIGFTTYKGTVTAATNWGEDALRKRVRPAIPGSIEDLFHETGRGRFLLPLRNGSKACSALQKPLLERAIGVIYRPETERQSHYFYANVHDQFDALIHIDRTRAVEPLERSVKWERGEVMETYPSGV
jgi:erythromycin esterase-like protein